jgi:hypothetical protein
MKAQGCPYLIYLGVVKLGLGPFAPNPSAGLVADEPYRGGANTLLPECSQAIRPETLSLSDYHRPKQSQRGPDTRSTILLHSLSIHFVLIRRYQDPGDIIQPLQRCYSVHLGG